MSDYPRVVREYILAARNLLVLDDLSEAEQQAVQETIEQLSAMLATHKKRISS